MFIYVDESGHTGTNLFDKDQPVLYYGVLSSQTNLDILAKREVQKARSILNVPRLHASELGQGNLIKIAKILINIQKKYNLRFDVSTVKKTDHAVICFFDQVFDQGMNPAVTWSGYWTPLRYMLLAKLALLFDEGTAELAWKARIELDDKKSAEGLIKVCQTILGEIDYLPDQRSRQLIGDALRWTINNHEKISYNCSSKKDVLSITPNIIGFQNVMHGIARRIKNPKAVHSIIVDQQSQFNQAQKTLADFYANTRFVPWTTGPGLPQMDLSNIPAVPIQFKSGEQSVGLELVDIYLWLFKRVLEQKEVAIELYPLIRSQLPRGNVDGVSINGLVERWGKVFENIPELTEEQLERAKELLVEDESRRLKAMGTE